jgi:hypothetical protein
MKLLKRISILAIAMVLALPAMAQFKIGPRVGINTSQLTFDETTFDSSNRVGYNGGLEIEFVVPVINLGFDLSAIYVHRTSEFMVENAESTNAETYKLSQNYIEIPLNLKYKLNLAGVGSLAKPYIFTGPSFSFLASKKDFNEFIHNKTCDIAWNVGIGVELIDHLQIGASYGFGITKAAQYLHVNSEGANIEGKNKYWTISAAWLF